MLRKESARHTGWVGKVIMCSARTGQKTIKPAKVAQHLISELNQGAILAACDQVT